MPDSVSSITVKGYCCFNIGQFCADFITYDFFFRTQNVPLEIREETGK